MSYFVAAASRAKTLSPEEGISGGTGYSIEIRLSKVSASSDSCTTGSAMGTAGTNDFLQESIRSIVKFERTRWSCFQIHEEQLLALRGACSPRPDYRWSRLRSSTCIVLPGMFRNESCASGKENK